VVVAAVLVFYLISLLLPDTADLAKEVDVKKEMIRKQLETLSRQEIYQTRVEQYRQHLQKDLTRLLPGDNPNVAEAELQKLLMSFADQSGVEINRKNTLPDKKIGDDIIQVSVSIELACDLEQLVRFLTAIENYNKFLKIEQFQITSFQTQRRQQIRPSLTVVGYISSQAPKNASSESAASADAPASAAAPAAVVVEQLDTGE
jgi:Tfp pilus assembly protein PilO